jgi:hypothetical protein
LIVIFTGTLKAAKKQNLVDFKGQMLLKGAHDNVIIYLLGDNTGASEELSQKPSHMTEESCSSSADGRGIIDKQLQESMSAIEEERMRTVSDAPQEIDVATTKPEAVVAKTDPCAGNLHVFESLMLAEETRTTATTTITTETTVTTTTASATTSDESNQIIYRYTLDELRTPGPYPSGVDNNLREQHLAPAEFLNLFQMNLDDFQVLPKWKRDFIKKKHNLF